MSRATNDLDTVRTARMIGERMRPEHGEALLAFHRDERVMATLGGVWTVDRAADALQENLRHWDDHGFGIWIFHNAESDRAGSANDRLVARGGLRWVEVGGKREVEIAYAVAADRWGRGIATELAEMCIQVAFERLKLESVVSFTMTTNIASQRVMQKTGLICERNVVHADLPHVLYRVTAGDWRATGNAPPANG